MRCHARIVGGASTFRRGYSRPRWCHRADDGLQAGRARERAESDPRVAASRRGGSRRGGSRGASPRARSRLARSRLARSRLARSLGFARCSPGERVGGAIRRTFIPGAGRAGHLPAVLPRYAWRRRTAARSPGERLAEATCQAFPGATSGGYARRRGRRPSVARHRGPPRTGRIAGAARVRVPPVDTWRNGQRSWAGGPDREDGHGPGGHLAERAAAVTRQPGWAGGGGTVPRTDPRRGSPSGRTGTVARRGGTGSAVGPPPAWS